MSKSDQQTVPSCSSHLADPFFEDDDLFLRYLLTHQHLLAGNASEDPTEISIAADTNNEMERGGSLKSSSKGKGKNVKQYSMTRKRSGKDRHSKICTAQGTRDRRMRLSLPIARRFFYLQDLLGFDKASKTIGWLFSKSREAIKELEQNILNMKQYSNMVAAKSFSSTTESEVVSTEVAKESTEENLAGFLKEKKSRKLHKVAKESRDMARARARVRAREKMILKGVEVSSEEGSKVKLSGNEANHHDFLKNHTNHGNINQKDLHCVSSSPSFALKISHDEDPSGGNNDHGIFQSFTQNWEIEFGLVEMKSPYCTTSQMKTLLEANNDQDQISNEVISHFKLQTSETYLPL